MIKPESRGFNSHPGQSFPLSLCGPNSISRANAHMVYGLKHQHFTLHSVTLDITYIWFLTVMCETKTKKVKNKKKNKRTNDQNRSNKQSSTLIINSRRKRKKAETPKFGILLLCRAKKQPSPIDTNCQIYLNC